MAITGKVPCSNKVFCERQKAKISEKLMECLGTILAEGDFSKTLFYSFFTASFLAAGALSLAFLVDSLSIKEIDFGLILLFAVGTSLILGFILDSFHSSREMRRKNILRHQKMLALNQERQQAREHGLRQRGSELFKSGFSTKKAVEDIEDYAEKFTINKGLILLIAALFDFLLLIWVALFL